MMLNAQSWLTDAIRLEDKSAKGKSGGVVYISTRLKEALADLLAISSPIGTILKTNSGKAFSAAAMTNWFWLLYRDLGFECPPSAPLRQNRGFAQGRILVSSQ